MPVYNGEKYLAGAIESILAQDYPHIEIIICDNASTDKTPKICRKYQQKEPRIIHYFLNDTNIGSSNNFNRTFTLANGEFFMWAAYDDLWDPTYIRKCVEKLRKFPSAVLCLTECTIIDETGKTIRNENDAIETLNLSLDEKFHHYFLNVGWIGSIVYGLCRSTFLRQTRLFLEEYGHDVILGLELYLLGDVVKVEESLFYYRYFQDKTQYDQIASITSDPVKQQNIARTAHTQLIKNLYQTLKTGNASQEIIQDFVKVIVYEQIYWARLSCIEHTELLKDQIIDPDYVFDFLSSLVTSETPPEEIINNIESPARRFQPLSAERPLIILGSFEVGVMTWWKYFNEHQIHVQALVDESLDASHPLLYERLLMPTKMDTLPFIILASQQPHIMKQQLEEIGYKHRKDFLLVNMNIPFLYLI